MVKRRDTTIYLPPERCQRTGLDDRIVGNPKIMRDLQQYKSKTPVERLGEAQDLNDIIVDSAAFKEFGLTLSSEPHELKSRRLVNPQIMKSLTKAVDPDKEQIRRLPIQEGVGLNSWLLVYGERDYNAADRFYTNLRKAKDQLGVDVKEP